MQQAGRDLAAAICTARKELQTVDSVPQWEGILAMMETPDSYSGDS